MNGTNFKRVFLAGMIGASMFAHAAQAKDEAAVSAKAKEEMAYLAGSLKAKYPTTTFSEISETPMNGVYELVTGKNIFYTDKEGSYLIMGSMYDMANSRDLTAERKEQLNKLDFSALDPAQAIVEVKGDGSRKLAVLTDVDCPYCKRLEETLKGVDNVTIYRYLYPIDSLHPNARKTSEAIWCLGDNDKRLTAFFNYVERGMAPAAGAECETPITQIQALAKANNLFGTPSLVNGKGAVLPGAAPRERLEAFLNQGADVAGNDQAVVISQEKKPN